MDKLLQTIEPFPSSSRLPVVAQDSFEGITLDEFLSGTGEETREVGTGEMKKRKKRGAGEISEIGAKESDCSTQREKRILKNRESAARSRERKQAYTLELEALVTKLEEENSMLLVEQMEFGQMRLKQLLENIIPITENKKPHSPLRRTRSMEF